ncbi:hypothetical protein PoB_004482100 [Plakobranchus ocellatus]|uniref:RRM domain-containing protein n=1 Tax=Plakobranchus ocellatus TaxID=259542 RepID=A0AAV4BHG6_9GAST|nr:hypothetical protein PoB_004482100 [Plakobranchus ocellatus]
MSTPLHENERLQYTACKWITPASHMKEMDTTPKTLVKKSRSLLTAPRLQCFTMLRRKNTGYAFCNFRKPEHLHLLVQSDQKKIRGVPKFRSMSRYLKSQDCDLFIKKVLTQPETVLS